MAADKETLLYRERLTMEVIDRISALEERAETAPNEVILKCFAVHGQLLIASNAWS